MCNEEDAAWAAPSAFGPIISPGKKRRKWDRIIRKGESVCMFWSGMFAFLNSKDRLKIYSLTQALFIENILRNELREVWEANEGECWLAINWCFSVHTVSFISIHAESPAFLKINSEELEIAYDGFKLCFHFLGWLEMVTTAPGIIF